MGKPNYGCQEAHPEGSPQQFHPEGSPQQFQLCVDYRKLNSLLPTILPSLVNKKVTLALMPLPKIDEVCAFLKGAKLFTALGL